MAGWTELAFAQEPVDGHVVPVMGITRHGEPVQPPTIRGRPLASNRQIELGETTLRQLGKRDRRHGAGRHREHARRP